MCVACAAVTVTGSEVATTSGSDTNTSTSSEVLSALLNTNLLADRNKAFELFRKSYRQNEVRGRGAPHNSSDTQSLMYTPQCVRSQICLTVGVLLKNVCRLPGCLCYHWSALME